MRRTGGAFPEGPGEEAEISVELGEGATADALWEALPIEARASLWEREIYFPASLSVEGKPDAREEVEVGDITYWPPGDAVCLFFGRTLASVDEKPCAASPVTVFGKIVGFGIFFLSRVPNARPDMTVDEYAPLVHGERTGTV